MAMTLFELQAKLGLNIGDFTDGLSQAKTEANNFSLESSVTMGNLMADAISGALSKAAEIAKETIGTIYNEFADYEQLEGGVRKIFGGSADTVLANASAAYETAGMSTNQYLATVMGYSTRLLQGLGGDTELAAYYADMALRDMADNVNTFGTSMSFVENAYQGFSRNNYTMLDNLKLGYGGTQGEMADLLNDSGVFDEYIMSDKIKYLPLHKIFEAIHVTQERLNVTGTTAAEASGTLSGSKAAASAALDNFLAGLADENADMDKLTSDLLSTGGTMAGNYFWKLPTIFQNVGDALRSVTGGEAVGAQKVIRDVASSNPAFVKDPVNLTYTLTWVGDKIEAMGARIESALQGAVVQLDGEKVGQVVLGWIDDKASTAMVAYGP
jgi:hypothetical protein